MHHDQMSNPAMRTKRQLGRGFGGRTRAVGWGIFGVGRNSGCDQGLRSFAGRVLAGAGQSVVAHFGKTPREDMLHETADEVLGAEGYAL